ncbi:MAG: diiron oxygenase [Chloroflexi bacterium]|nr:MAG: diiron oxygenase [Chloroflexota bacterium]
MVTPLAEEQSGTWDNLLERLNRQSVLKHFDAYVDVPWDEPGFSIDPADSRWQLEPDHPLGATDWYRSQPAEVRSRIGLHMIATQMKLGLQFESVLKRGLLEWAADLPNGSAAFRYAYHEVIEEAQHSLMFQEFVNRAGFDTPGLSRFLRFQARQVIRLGRKFPELFFVFVLGGEDPIDHVQRVALRNGDSHPLLLRIMRIHVTEEARHLSFARQYLRDRVPQLSWLRRQRLAINAPLILGVMAQTMMQPSPQMVKEYGIPRSVIRAAYKDNPRYRQQVLDSLRKVRELLIELRLMTPMTRPIWRRLRIWEAGATETAA